MNCLLEIFVLAVFLFGNEMNNKPQAKGSKNLSGICNFFLLLLVRMGVECLDLDRGGVLGL